MLDLDDIAERHAQALKQDAREWHSAIWNDRFQRLTQSMTDGEIREFVWLCDSCERLAKAVGFIFAAGEGAVRSPMSHLRQAAETAGQDPTQYVRSLS